MATRKRVLAFRESIGTAREKAVLDKPRQIGGLLGWLLACFAAAAIGGASAVDAGPFYLALSRPDWAPPAGVFGPVWTMLFAAMALAAWLVWRTRGFTRDNRAALSLFAMQLAANALWSWLFFAWHRGQAALAEMLILWGLVFMTAVLFWRLQRVAGLLLLPYLAWISFALLLNWALLQRNPTLL